MIYNTHGEKMIGMMNKISSYNAKEDIKVRIKGKDSNTSRTVKVQVIPGGILADMGKESLNPRVYKECTLKSKRLQSVY